MFLDNHHNAITVDLRTIFLGWKLRSTLSNIDADQPKQEITRKDHQIVSTRRGTHLRTVRDRLVTASPKVVAVTLFAPLDAPRPSRQRRPSLREQAGHALRPTLDHVSITERILGNTRRSGGGSHR
jgi:hypothetical protein